MFRLVRFLLFTVASLSPAQSPSGITFEVASVKKAAPWTPSTTDNGSPGARLVRFRHVTLQLLLMKAWQTKAYQIIGPKWIETEERYDIVAKLPESADRKLVPLMLRTLLAERFRLRIHEESRQLTVFKMLATQGDSKLKKTVAVPPPQDENGGVSISGLAEAESLGKTVRGVQYGGGKLRAGDVTLVALADFLSGLLEYPVFDHTGIPGSYDFDLSVAPTDVAARWSDFYPAEASNGSESIFAALRQYGLKLQKGMSQVSVIVIDHVEREPTPN